MVQVEGDGVAKLRVLAVKLKAADPKLRSELRRKIGAQADPLVRKVQRSVLEMRSEHSVDHSFREQLAHTVYASVTARRTGVAVEIVSSGRRMPLGMQNLNSQTDDPDGWGHPVFADRSKPRSKWVWVKPKQRGKPGWFELPVVASQREVAAAVQDAIDEVDRFLT